MLSKPQCQYCHNTEPVKLRKRINGNGSYAVFWYCTACERSAQQNRPSIKHELVSAYLGQWHRTISDVPVLEDYTQDTEPCVICGAQDTEFNHWLPQMFAERPEIAPEWDTWANVGAPLCRHHHALWHRIVTPYMPGIGQSRT